MSLTQVSYGMTDAGLQSTTNAFKNRIINGDMRIDQRNAGTSVAVSSNTYVVDRWNNYILGSATGRYTSGRSATAPAGFTNSNSITVTTADAAPSTLYGYALVQSIEGYNIGDLGWGTANAQPITISFWVRSSLTGTFGLSLVNDGVTQGYTATYSISSPNTWEYKTITIAGATNGTWATSNTLGMNVGFCLGGGATRTAISNNAWVAPTGTYYPTQAVGGVNVLGTVGATFYVTGVQVEKGTTATSFDFRAYASELAICQRYLPAMGYSGGSNPYFGSGMAYSTSAAYYTISFPVAPRVPPTGLTVSAASHFAGFLPNTATSNSTSVVFGGADSHSAFVGLTGMSGLTAGNATLIYMSSPSALMTFTGCEL